MSGAKSVTVHEVGIGGGVEGGGGGGALGGMGGGAATGAGGAGACKLDWGDPPQPTVASNRASNRRFIQSSYCPQEIA